MFFNGLSTKAQEMILEVKNIKDQQILLTKLLNTQTVKKTNVVATDMDILNVTEEQSENNTDLTNHENSETKQINLK